MSKSRAARRLVVGAVHEKVMLETCRDSHLSRPRVRPVSHFPSDTRVWFPRSLRERFPIGTRFYARVKVSQKPKGPPYLSASEIQVIVASIPGPGLRAKLKPGSKSGRAYTYTWD